MTDIASDELKPLSTILAELGEEDQPVSAQKLVERFGAQAFGTILFIFAFACALPLPPGASTIFGAPLVLLSPQIAVGRRAPWLPRSLRGRSVPIGELRKVAARMSPWLRRIEMVSRPRLGFLFGPIGDRVIGAVCTVLSLVLILPIPLGNLLPATAVGVLALALLTRDGFLALAGYAVTVASLGVLVIAAGIVVHAVQHAITLISGA